MPGDTTTICDEEFVLIPVQEFEELVRDSERMAIARDYVSTEKYALLIVIAKILGVELPKAKEGEK